ncbi:hypothetical protein SEA_FLATWOODS_41 [Gordonia phage Flatwoods]|uniref:Minor tail protein n=1 Tax=Gordonia phage Tangerine TaxID=2591120 RepID=A0A515ML10_9CAUD|nr:minor tail protein [Gordonia phage Tangerine]QDM57339.1 hypothetical protein SEA_TANGERINE_40 [Gordonia phage Tangerine]URP21108.1 hypothetical protein SEA_FLATWOODS_41 [Gordonia phage Flatwoods]
MIPGVRFRASRRRGGGASLGFVQAVGVAGSNQAPSVEITSAGGSASKFIIGTTSNSYGGLGVTMDGVALTPYGFVSATRIHQLFIVNAVAGAHTFVVDGGGSWETMIVAEYQGVTSVGPYTSKVSSSQVATHTPDGSGALAVALVAGVAASAASPNYVGTPRFRQIGLSNSQSIALVESPTAPLGINASGSAMSVGCVWLS